MITARAYLVFVGASGFIFGQLFFGQFSWGATLAGVGGVVVGILGQRATLQARLVTGLACTIGIAGVAMDAFGYYSRPHAPGNDYAWILVGIFAAGLVFVGYLNAKPTHQ